MSLSEYGFELPTLSLGVCSTNVELTNERCDNFLMQPEYLRKKLFNDGAAAFAAAFPQIAASVSEQPTYVCPLCLRAFGENALSAKQLTLEHVPPESVGGTLLVLACARCNNSAGTLLEDHLRKEADWIGFAMGNLPERKAMLGTGSAEIPVRLVMQDRGIQIFGVPQATSPSKHSAVFADFEAASVPDGWIDFKFQISMPAFAPSRAVVAWLKAAYLAFFAELGYRFIFRRELDIVRSSIAKPGDSVIPCRLFRPENAPGTRQLVRVDEPQDLRSFVFIYDQHMIFLPRFGDEQLYDRLSSRVPGNARMSGREHPFPKRAGYRWDHVAVATAKGGENGGDAA